MRVAGIALIFATLLLSCTESPEKRLANMEEKIQRQCDRYELDQALGTCGELAEMGRNPALFHYGMGLVSERRLMYLDALPHYLAALDADASYQPARERLLRIYRILSENTLAIKAATQLTRTDRTNPRHWLAKTDLLLGAGDETRARLHLDSAEARGLATDLAAVTRSQVLAAAGFPDSAEASLASLPDKVWSQGATLRGLSLLLEATGRVDSALAVHRRYIELSGAGPDAFEEHFRLALRHNYLWEARQAWRKIDQLGADSLVLYSLATEYYRAAGDRLRSRDAAARLRHLAGETMAAIYIDTRARTANGDLRAGLRGLSVLNRRLDDPALPEGFSALALYLTATRMVGDIDAKQNLDQIGRVPPPYYGGRRVQLAKLQLLSRTGQFDEFESLAERLRLDHGNQADWLAGLANCYAEAVTPRPEVAEELYREALRIDPTHAGALSSLLRMYRKLERRSEALQFIDRFDGIVRRRPDLRLLEAYLLAESNQAQAAWDAFAAVAPDLSGNLDGFIEMELVLRLAGADRLAEQVFALLVELEPENPDALARAAMHANDEDRFDRAEELADRALAVESENLDGYAEKARAVYGRGNVDEALSLLEEAATVDLNHALTNMYWSSILAETGQDMARAANLARQALFWKPGDLRVLMNLCRVYFRTGRYDLCQGEAQRAARAHPQAPEPLFWLGAAQHRLGRADAETNLREAIDKGLPGDLRQQADSLLRDLQ